MTNRILTNLKQLMFVLTAFFLAVVGLDATQVIPQVPTGTVPVVDPSAPAPVQRLQRKRITTVQRQAAAQRLAKAKQEAKSAVAKGQRPMGIVGGTHLLAAPVMDPQGHPDYLGLVGNYAYSQLPTVTNADPVTGIGTVTPGTGIRKFVDTLPGVGFANRNNLGQFIPLAIPDTTTYPGSDYYELGLVDYTQQMHSDLPKPTKLRGYIDRNPNADGKPHYLGPIIIAQKDRPTRVKLTNNLGIGAAGNLFLPVDHSAMGAGYGPLTTTTIDPITKLPVYSGSLAQYTENRALLHLHGGDNPWISDGTPHQWITPVGENTTPYLKGVTQVNVPDMPDPGQGSSTWYYPNGLSARMLWYHDHAFGLTRLNVYAGEVSAYILTDPVEENLIQSGILPGAADGLHKFGIPLIIQDKTFVPDQAQLVGQDPTWDLTNWGTTGDLWLPHVYMPNQNPADVSGAAPMGRWDYGPWFWPVWNTASGLIHGPETIKPDPADATTWYDVPGTPNPSLVPEAFMDTPVINGQPYPSLTVEPRAYRFRILNGSNDRYWNLSWFQADPANPTEVRMVPAATGLGLPANWPMDGRDGGAPDPTLLGPDWIQVGNEGGFLPSPAVIAPQPVTYEYNRRNIVVLDIVNHGLLLGAAERADVIVDFSAYAGKTLILYNDAPTPNPAFDTRYDFYTGDPDQTSTGGAPTTQPGYGPNTRTIMQVKVNAGTPVAYDMAPLTAAFAGSLTTTSVFAATHEAPLVPQLAYNDTYGTGTTIPDQWARIQSTSITYKPFDPLTKTLGAPVTTPLQPKAIQELFELNYGRMNATLGVELPNTNFQIQTTIPLNYGDPGTEFMKDGTVQMWKITHNGVDTHPVHFHLFNVQVINRVGWDGAVRLPDANELGWKETVRMKPLEDIIVAMRPTIPQLPFHVDDSVRALDPTQPTGVPIQVTNIATGNFITVNNDLVNNGWEYVWHCHILGHEENDFMRTVNMDVPKLAFSGKVTLSDLTTPVAGVKITPSGGMAPIITGVDGSYTFQHSPHWNGTVTASLTGYTFAPPTYTYSNVSTSQTAQNFVATGAPVISGVVTTGPAPATPLAGVTITLSNGGGSVLTAGDGSYVINAPSVPGGWTGTISASLSGYLFSPVAISLVGVVAPTPNQDFTATPAITIGGQVTHHGIGLAGVSMTYAGTTNGSVPTDGNGNYTLTVPSGWTGTVTPVLGGFRFTPLSYSYSNITTNQTAQNFATASSAISGIVSVGGTPLANVTMTASNSGGSALTDATGAYSLPVPYNWSGTVTPAKANFSFAPGSGAYSNVITDQPNQNYAATAIITVSGQVTSAGAPMANVTLTATGGFTTTTNAQGTYSLVIPSPWTGSITPSMAGFVFNPSASNTYSNQITDVAGVNFAAQIQISGIVSTAAASPVAGVLISYAGGSVLTDASGSYTLTLTPGWSGTLTPSKAGYAFTPLNRSYGATATSLTNQNFTAAIAVTVYGLVTTNTVPSLPLSGVTITFSNGAGSVVTDAAGIFTHYVPSGYTGSITPSAVGYRFNPVLRNLNNLTTNISGQNFTAIATVVVSGNISNGGVPLAGVRVAFSNGGGAVNTDAAGNYTQTLDSGWSGTITPTLRGYIFSPATVSLAGVTTNQTVNFVTYHSISGKVKIQVNGNGVGLAGVTLSLSSGGTTTTDAQGRYTFLVPMNWTGSVTPSGLGKVYTPALLSYTNLTTNQTGQNFAAQ
jgi:FtsP/CotA-like multicopper oxidase with cupredoxin domain